MARARRLVQDRNLARQLSAVAERTPGLTSKATPLGNATKMAGARRLTHSRNLARQLSAVAERMPGLASKATPLGDAAKMAVAFVAGAH